MKEVKYMISDTAKKVEVEAHVLRYWEEELELPIGRNEMGHRYYTSEDIVLFKNVKELKEQGFQLKAIRMLLPELIKRGEGVDNLLFLRDEMNQRVADTEVPVVSRDDKLQQFEEILSKAVKKALVENNTELSREMGNHVSERLLKEMDYVVRVKEEREEERFKHLDETIRLLQKTRQETAAARREESAHRRKTFFKRKGSSVS